MSYQHDSVLSQAIERHQLTSEDISARNSFSDEPRPFYRLESATRELRDDFITALNDAILAFDRLRPQVQPSDREIHQDLESTTCRLEIVLDNLLAFARNRIRKGGKWPLTNTSANNPGRWSDTPWKGRPNQFLNILRELPYYERTYVDIIKTSLLRDKSTNAATLLADLQKAHADVKRAFALAEPRVIQARDSKAAKLKAKRQARAEREQNDGALSRKRKHDGEHDRRPSNSAVQEESAAAQSGTENAPILIEQDANSGDNSPLPSEQDADTGVAALLAVLEPDLGNPSRHQLDTD